NSKTFAFFERFYTDELKENYVLVNENDEISLGKNNLKFIMAPMVHWPEVMMTYETTNNILFSADAFGSFNALDGNIFADELDFNGRLLDEFRRYYVNVVGKHGANVGNVLKKISNLQISMLCPLHGPVYRQKEDIDLVVNKYKLWADYEAETDSILLIYGSMYGHTEKVVSYVANKLAQKKVKDLKMFDVSHTDHSYIVSEMFKYKNIIIATANYNTQMYFKTENLIHEALALNIKNKNISLIVNYTWGGQALKKLQEAFGDEKKFKLNSNPLEIKSAFKDSDKEIVENFIESVLELRNS
ncbi:MAG: flavodoxin domain-containing protein, partial [Campylobacteraceae bacterium]